MIIEFSVANFRSIRDEQTFSLFAETVGSHLVDNIAKPPAPGNIPILKAVGVYGANASGKSNLLRAIQRLCDLVIKSRTLSDGDPIPSYEPYLLSENAANEPVKFEIEFVIPKGDRFLYRIAFLQNRIVEERLSQFKTAREALLFDRKPSSRWDEIEFGSAFKGRRRKIGFFDNQSYLSVAGGNPESPEIAREIYNYFFREIVILGVNSRISRTQPLDDGDALQKLSGLLATVDTGVRQVIVKEEYIPVDKLNFSPEIRESAKLLILQAVQKRNQFVHQKDDGSDAYFERDMESDGTQKMFDLGRLAIDAFDSGGVIIVDELDCSMHPFMAASLIRLFNDPEVNPTGAQLIFTTHNISLMSSDVMRRDQIWFAEKSKGASRYYSLDHFDKKKVTPAAPFGRWYEEGRFGAVPIIQYRELAESLSTRNDHAKE